MTTKQIQVTTSDNKLSGKELSLKEWVEDWVDKTDGGWFDVHQIYETIEVKTREERKHVSVILGRLKKDGIIKPDDKRHGRYRKIIEDLPELSWREADVSNIVPLKWPFGLERYVNIYPKNICVGAGDFDAGKTALFLNIIRLNMNDFEIVYFNSEMGPEELKLRLSKFDIPLDTWNFKSYERSGNFADVIFPDKVNIIDYLEISEEFWLVAKQIKEIHDCLKKGIAIIALQKKRGAELGSGSDKSAEKARLYLSINGGRPFSKLKIIKAKNWVNPEINPNGLEWEFKLHNGCEFQVMSEPAELLGEK